MSQANVKDGIGLTYEMPYWGEIRFSKHTIGNDIGILVTNITFNRANFFQFIKYYRYSKSGQPIIIGNLNYGHKLIKQQGSRLTLWHNASI